ncbi:MAG: type II toxin-antitoxin system VapC family toxin [Candidatus Njordarchaeales archaeon]
MQDDKKHQKDRLSGKRLLLIDSSFLMLPVSGRRKKILNIEDALFKLSEGRVLAVLSSTVRELEFLKNNAKGKKRLAADFALELIKRAKFPIIEVDKEIEEEVMRLKEKLRNWEVHDEILARMAKKLKAAVATTDLELMHKLRDMGVPVYYLRGKKWIYVSGE